MSNLPPGVMASDIPGNRPKDFVRDEAVDKLHEAMKRLYELGEDKEDVDELVDEIWHAAKKKVKKEKEKEHAAEIKMALESGDVSPDHFDTEDKNLVRQHFDVDENLFEEEGDVDK